MPKRKAMKPKRNVRSFIRAIDTARYNELLAKLGLSLAATARFYDVADWTVRKLARGDTVVNPSTARLLELMGKTNTTPEEALKLLKPERDWPARYGTLSKRLGLTRRGAARFLGIDDRTSRHYAAGDTLLVPRRMILLLELLAKTKTSPDDALRLIGIRPYAALREAIKEFGPRARPVFYEDRKEG